MNPARSPAAVRRRRTLAVAGLIAAACAPSTPRGLDGYFEEAGRVVLEEAAGDPIAAVPWLTRRPGGGFVLADEQAGHVRLFDAAGRQEAVLGRPGDGPGEFDASTAAVELPSGRVLVTEGDDPVLTIFEPGSEPRQVELPGNYGTWLDRIGEDVVVGMGSRGERFAILSAAGSVRSTFGAVAPEVNEIPFWIFFARDHGTVLGDRVAINTSFYPTVRLFDAAGDSAGVIGEAPSFWEQPGPPPLDRLAGPGDRERVAAWARGFTVVRRLVAVADTLLVVQYGRHEPVPGDPYHVRPTRVDVYTPAGHRLAEGLELPYPVVGGGTELLVLTRQPPDPWEVTLYRWQGRP